MEKRQSTKKAIVLLLAKRLLSYVITLFVGITVTFVLFRLVPGNPIGALITSMEQQYSYSVPEARSIINEYKKTFNLDGDLFTQYVTFLRELILHQNLGPSFLNFPKPAQELIARAIPWSVGLLTISVIISWILGNIMGAIAGWLKERKISQAFFIFSLFFSQIPSYFIAIILVLVFGYILTLLPTRGAYSPNIVPGLTLEFIFDVIRHGTLPALSLILVSFCGWIISMRSLVVSILGEDYLIFAEAKGLPKSKIFNRYVMRNALLPQVTGLAMTLGFTVNGSLIVESIFVYPGIGTLFSNAIAYLDYNTIYGCVLISMLTVLTANLILDFLYPLIDPRVRVGGR